MVAGRWIHGAVASLLLAGCLGGEDAPDEPQASPPVDDLGQGSPLPGPVASAMTHGGCRQYHTFFGQPLAAFPDDLPEGWSYAAEDPAGVTTVVYVSFSFCANGTVGPAAVQAFGEMWVSVRVNPAEPYVLAGAVQHQRVLAAVLTDATVAEAYAGLGFEDYLDVGTGSWTDVPAAPPARAGRVTIESSAGTYELLTQLGPSSEGTAAGAIRVFRIEDRAVVAGFDYAWPSWTDLGLGQGQLAFAGDFLHGGPPLSDGLAHEVADVAVTFTPLALEPAGPT